LLDLLLLVALDNCPNIFYIKYLEFKKPYRVPNFQLLLLFGFHIDGYRKFDNYWLNLGQFLQTNYPNSISLNTNLEKEEEK
jgi:hypothetical protein